MHPTLRRLARTSLRESLAAHSSAPTAGSPGFQPQDDEPAWALVVSSDGATRVQLGHAVTALGYEAVTAADAGSARDRLNDETSRPSLVILDRGTSHSAGLVHSLRRRPEVPLVLCGTRGSGFVRDAAVEADGFVPKPLQLPGVIAELRATLHRTPAQRLAIRRARLSLAAS